MLRNAVGCVIPDVSKALDPSQRRELLNDTVSNAEDLNLLRCTDLLVHRNEVETTCLVFGSARFESGLT
jgi:hypothetical protein